MKFEGTQVNIPIKGIMRAGTDNLCADGAMQEVVGMEYKDGSWIPYKDIEKNYVVLYSGEVVPNVVDVYVHKTTDSQSHLLFHLDNDALVYQEGPITESSGVYYVNVADLAYDVKDVSFVGNMVCLATEGGMKYFIWKNGAYSQKEQITNSNVPRLSFRMNKGVYNETIGEDAREGLMYTTYADGWGADVINDMDVNRIKLNAMISSMVAVRGELRDRGGLTGYVLVCYAYRMKNGDLVQASAPVLLGRPMENVGDKVVNRNDAGDTRESTVFPYETSGTLDVNVSDDKSAILAFNVLPNIIEGSRPKEFDYILPKEVSILAVGSDTYNYSSHPKNMFGTDDTTLLLIHKDGWSGTRGKRPMVPTPGASYDSSVDAPSIPPLSSTLYSRQPGSTDAFRSQINAYALSNELQLRIDSAAFTNDDVQSVCVFMSEEIDPFVSFDTPDIDNVVVENYRGYVSIVSANDERCQMVSAKFRSKERILKDLYDIKSLYLIKEVYKNEFEELYTAHGNNWFSISLEGLLGDNLVVRDQLPISAFDLSSLCPERLDSYNYRLHAYDYLTELFNGYEWNEITHNGGLGQYKQSAAGGERKWEIRVELTDELGNSKVVTYSPSAVSNLPKLLTPILSYPSLQANKMTIRLYIPGSLMYYEREYAMRPIEKLGISAFIDPNLELIDIATGIAKTDYPTSIPVFEDENNIRTYANGLRVSDVAYPNYFPPAYTYRIGNEKIIGLARLTIPMGQDNFGRNSLIIFCTDGIYSLRVDASGNGVYTNTDFVSPEVCVNRNSICEIGGAVFFAGDKGLMMLTGDTNGNVQLYGPHLNGAPRFLYAATESKEAHGVYRKMLNNTAILSKVTTGDFVPCVSYDAPGATTKYADFADFIKNTDTHLVYISIKNKLLAYNNNKEYSYFIDIPTGNTTKLALSALCDDGIDVGGDLGKGLWKAKDPSTGSYTVHTLGYLSAEDNTIQCLILTRPIKVQQDDKCSYRVVLTGYFEGLDSNWADLVVMGSLDGDHWRTIGVKEKKLSGGFHNLGCLTERGSWKYLMFIFGGKLSHESHIDSVDITVEGRYNNKKR